MILLPIFMRDLGKFSDAGCAEQSIGRRVLLFSVRNSLTTARQITGHARLDADAL